MEIQASQGIKQQNFIFTRRPLIQEPTRQKAMTVSWYSSSVACAASSRAARGSTVRANATATASDTPSDITTLRRGSHGGVTHTGGGSQMARLAGRFVSRPISFSSPSLSPYVSIGCV